MIVLDPKNPRGIVWLASYPKSGNTWVRAFLHVLYNILVGHDPRSIDLNNMNELVDSDRQAERYEKYLGKPVREATMDEIAALRPRVQEDIALGNNTPVLVKTHNPRLNDGGIPMINQKVTAGAVYIVRNPLDVAVSFASFRSVAIDEMITDMANDEFGVESSEHAIYYAATAWSTHVRSWTERPSPDVHVVRYEDMLDKPTEAFAAIANHVMMPHTGEQLRRAIELTDFSRLQKTEMASGFRERPETAEQFFRAGRSGEWRDKLTPGQVARIVADHGGEMARFGYLPEPALAGRDHQAMAPPSL